MTTSACKFHKTGHCKFGQTCRRFHSDNLCSLADCDNNCLDRHPKTCLFYVRFGQCKFGDRCSYLHPSHGLANDVEKVKHDLQHVLKILKEKEKQIKQLEDKISTLEATVEANHRVINVPSAEKMRNIANEESLHLSLDDEEREEFSSPPNSPVSNFGRSKCDYWLCEYECSSESLLNQHIVEAHSIDSTFTYPNSSEKVICVYDIGPQDLDPDCEQCGEEFFLDHAFAMHLYNSHKVGYDCVHCSKYFPGGDEMYAVHLKLCTAPCDGHRHCPCRK